uniref:Uncharacterized protein LOC104247496 n=1 Tax=Nicotiana sylvestris TaxID=4096 RepID=A0A1U7YIR9_NICSY
MPLIGQLPCNRIRSKVLNAGPSTGESPRTLSRSKESNRTPVIGESPRSRSRSKEANRTPFIGESSRTQSRSNRSTSDFDDNELLDTICSRLMMEVQRHAEKERSTIVKEVFDKFKKEERSAFVDAVFVKVKINHYKVADVNATREETTFVGDQHVQEQFEEERPSADRLSRDGNDEAQLSTENIGSKQGADNQVVETEEHNAHDALCKVADDNATHKEAAVKGDEHAQQQGGEEQSNVCRQSKDGNDEELTTEKGSDDQVVGTEKHAPSCPLVSDIEKELKASDVSSTIGKDDQYAVLLAICKELLGGDTQEIVTTENTPILLDVGSQLNEAVNADIDKGIDKERLETTQKEFGELMQLYEKGEIHIFTHVASQKGFPPAAEQQQLVVTEQQEEQAKRKPDKKGKRI